MSENLIKAAEKGDIETVKSEITNGADINAMDENGENALIWASCKGHIDIVTLLVRNRADINAKNRNALSPLMAASSYGRTDIVKLLLSCNSDVHASDNDNDTALMMASRGNYTNIVKQLLCYGADTEARYKNGRTAKEWAFEWGNSEVVEIFNKFEKLQTLKSINKITSLTPAQIVLPKNRTKLNVIVKSEVVAEVFEMMDYSQQEAMLHTLKDKIMKDKALMSKIIPIMQASFAKIRQEQNAKPDVQQTKLFETFALQLAR